MPQTLTSLTSEEIILLAREIIAAENILQNSPTGLRLREHLQARIGEVVEQIREGIIPPDAEAAFHRPRKTSACRQPWQSPLIGALGKVAACCGGAPPIGTLAEQSMRDIMNGEAVRAVRASILEGRPIIPCETCSFAEATSFAEFNWQIREWMGDTTLPPFDSDVQNITWPGLMGAPQYTVAVENSKLNTDGGGAAALIEGQANGFHRVFFDIARAEYSEIRFRVRPAGRRGLRLDLCQRETMVGRAHIVLSHQSRVTTPIGPVDCVVTPAHDRWYDVTATFPGPRLVSEIGFNLLREDGAVKYPGDGHSGLEIAAVSIG
jgi:hypothetical protein